MITAVVINWNGRHYLEGCLAAVLAQEPRPGEVIVVDNHSDDGSRELVQERFPGVRVIDTGANVGPAAARNAGLRASGGERVLLVDNDVVLRAGALAQLNAALDADPGTAMVQARSVCADRPDVVHYDGADLHYLGMLVLHIWFTPLADAKAHGASTGAVIALCVLCDRRALLEVGGFAERLFILYEDNELSWKLRLRGSTLRLLPLAVCVHKGGTAGLSVRGEGARYPARRTFLHTRNRTYVLLTCMHWRTLIVTLPMQALYGFVQFAFACRQGHVRAWLGAKWELVRLLPEIVRRRRMIQRSRRVPDRELLVAAPLTLNPGIAQRGVSAVARRVLDACFIGWWRITRRLCG